MPKPLQQLRNDHELTRGGIRVLRAVADSASAGGPFAVADAALVLRFFHEFVEGVHHAKESDHLYPAVALHGDDAAAEACGLLYGEHDETRALLHSLMMFWEPVDDLTPAEREGFARTAATYAQRLERHMDLEEQRLFRSAEEHVPADDMLTIAEEFARLDADRRGASHWQPILADLADRWLR